MTKINIAWAYFDSGLFEGLLKFRVYQQIQQNIWMKVL
jgi:hypothetical protein